MRDVAVNDAQSEERAMQSGWDGRRPFGRKRPVADPAALPAPLQLSALHPPSFESSMCALTYGPGTTSGNVLGPNVVAQLRDGTAGGMAGRLEGGSTVLNMASGIVAVMMIDRPMPLPNPPDSLPQRVVWDGWRADAAQWRAHLIVAAMGVPDSIAIAREAAKDVLKVAAILARNTPVRGVNWMSQPIFCTADSFLARCQAHAVPPDLVIFPVFYGRKAADGSSMTGARTKGLKRFGLPEIDHQLSCAGLQSVHNRLLNLASYVLTNGPVLNPGDTIGIDENVQGRIGQFIDADGEAVISVSDVG